MGASRREQVRRQRRPPPPVDECAERGQSQVADTGPGIRPEFHLEIFDDFFRLPGSESAEGMGLGLAISRRLLQAMGGKIWVESEPGTGCKFSFLIPLKPILSSPPRGAK